MVDCQRKIAPPIRGFIPTSLNEWQGMIAAVVFLPGCNWRCPYCHGWRFIREPEALPLFSSDSVFESLDKNKGWIDGVVVTGGEATLHKELLPFLQALNDRDLKVKLHSNGSRPEVLKEVLQNPWVDCLAMDFKAPFCGARLEKAVGTAVDPALLEESFALAKESKVPVELHTTLCPAVLDLSDVERMARELQTRLPEGRWVWQQYNPEDVLNAGAAGLRRYEKAQLEELATRLRTVVPNLELRGV